MPGPSPTGPRPPPRSQRQPVAGLLTPAFCPYLVRVGIPPALLLGPVQPGVQLLDQASVLLGMQRRGPHPGLGSFCSRFTSLRNRSYTTNPAPHGRTRCSAFTRICSSGERSCASSTPGSGTGRHPCRLRWATPQRNPGHVPSTTHFPSAVRNPHPAAGDRPGLRFLPSPRRIARVFRACGGGSRRRHPSSAPSIGTFAAAS